MSPLRRSQAQIGVASTKAFTCQLAARACLAISLGRARSTIDEPAEAALLADFIVTSGFLSSSSRRWRRWRMRSPVRETCSTSAAARPIRSRSKGR
jgi:hypothetical protein